MGLTATYRGEYPILVYDHDVGHSEGSGNETQEDDERLAVFYCSNMA